MSMNQEWMTKAEQELTEEVEELRAQLATIEALVSSEEATKYRDEACRNVVDLPYASNRYIRLLDDIRAALR